MSVHYASRRSVLALAVYDVLNPVVYGCFVAAMIFDIVYARSAVMLWAKGAAWLIVFGLLFAIVPRVINLVQVWVTSRRIATRADQIDFWLNLLAIIAAIFNAFVHSRDAYGIVPASVVLSVVTVVLLAVGRVVAAVQYAAPREHVDE